MTEIFDTALASVFYFLSFLVLFSIFMTLFPNELLKEKSLVLGRSTVQLIFNITIKDAVEMFGPLVVALFFSYIDFNQTFKAIITLMGLVYLQSILAMIKYLFSKS